MDMKKKIRKIVQNIIDEKYQTDWEFICDQIAPELDEQDFDVDEICMMVEQEKEKRRIELYAENKKTN